MNIQLLIPLLSLAILGCQPSAKNAHLSDPVHQFLEAEIAKVDKMLMELEKEQSLLTTQLPEDLVSLRTLKSAAFKANRFRIQKAQRMAQQERIFLQIAAKKRALQVQKRFLAGEKDLAPGELATFKSRYRSNLAQTN